MSQQQASGGRGRTSLLLIAAVGFIPLVITYLMFFFFPEWIPRGTTNEGTLIQPPLSIMDLGEETRRAIPGGKWTFMISATGACTDPCREAIYLARQVDAAVGKDSNRVQRVLLVGPGRLPTNLREELLREYPDMLVHYDMRGRAAEVLGRVLTEGTLDGKIFLADPNGNIILIFDQAEGGNSILKDLKHLLRLSNIG